MKSNEELTIITKTYDLILWSCNHTSRFPRNHRYVLKADIRKFFPSMDHRILQGWIARRIKDPGVLWLVQRIIDSSNPQEPVLMWFPGDELFSPALFPVFLYSADFPD